MIRPSRQFGRVVSALLFVLLISVQTISLAHAYEHDPAAQQDTACATCASINQLTTVAVDHGDASPLQPFSPVICTDLIALNAALLVTVPRQRGPPASP